MRHSGLPVAIAVCALAALSCGSSAPYTLTSAALNTGLALGASASERAAGGCYAICTAGAVCNPRTGFCEREPVAPCVRGGPGCGPGDRAPLNLDQLVDRPGGDLGRTIGVSPETGRAPPPLPGATVPERR